MPLPSLSGRAVPFALALLTHVSDLLYYDGPFLSEFVGPTGESYLAAWTDADDAVNRWLLVPVQEAELVAFKRGHQTLRALVLAAPTVLLFDLDNDLACACSVLVASADLAPEYLPPVGSILARLDNPVL